jgi:SAM-dependent methyltransferase
MESTIWDKIYKDYEKKGGDYATLGRGLNPDFMEFVDSTDFPVKKAFDIGHGTGHYMVWLKVRGWEANGIDSSETAHNMAEKALGQDNLVLDDVYKYQIPKNKFGLVLSVHAIHHGLKPQVETAVSSVYEGLVNGGWIYLTLPVNDVHKQWHTHKNSKLIAPGTFAPASGPEKDLPHSFYTEDEVKELFSKYQKLNYSVSDRGVWKIIAQK